MLEDLAAFHELESAALTAKIKQLAAALRCLTKDKDTRSLLNLLPADVTVSQVMALFRKSDKLVIEGKFEGSGGARAMGTFRTFVFEQAYSIDLAEEIDEQTVRFKPQAKVVSDPRALISDLTDFAGDQTSLPIGATSVKSVIDLQDAIRAKANADLVRVRQACIRDMEIAAVVRQRVNDLNRLKLDPRYKAAAIESMQDDKNSRRSLDAAKMPTDVRLQAILRIIEIGGLAHKNAPYKYSVSSAAEMRSKLFEGFPVFSSQAIFEIAQHACPEEIFAAFHLLQTHTSWNFSSVMAITEDRVDVGPKSVIIQGFKDKTNDDTPEVEIDLDEPGISTAIDLLKWNRQQMILLGHLDKNILDLWVVVRRRESKQEAYTFHPQMRHTDFKKRNGLPDYSLDQVRTQFLFIRSLSKGGIGATQVFGGHEMMSTSGRYVENIIQDRISSAMNLAFTKQLEAELIYIHDSKAKDLNSLELSLLKPIGDGTSCLNPNHPPPGRSRDPDNCDGQRCHTDGGCPNRKIRIDSARIEEIVRTRFHHQSSWQRAWQSNPERFAHQQLPAILFNEALYQVVSAGPFGSKIHRMAEELKGEISNDQRA